MVTFACLFSVVVSTWLIASLFSFADADIFADSAHMVRFKVFLLTGLLPAFLPSLIQVSFLNARRFLVAVLPRFIFMSSLLQLRRSLATCDLVLTAPTSIYVRQVVLAFCADAYCLSFLAVPLIVSINIFLLFSFELCPRSL